METTSSQQPQQQQQQQQQPHQIPQQIKPRARHEVLFPCSKIKVGSNEFEVSLHSPPLSVLREFHHIFGPTFLQNKELFIIPTIQPSLVGSLLNWTNTVAQEKDRLLESFLNLCTSLLPQILPPHLFFDYIDPCSGLPMLNERNKIWDEVAGCSELLGLRVYNAGGCKVLTHDEYGDGGYPASIFLGGDREEVVRFYQMVVNLYSDNNA
ncbi:hypothetical protein TrLO_g1155 [Triparma laevis f. longispina]|uniref:Uncharacterized protein n=1 Tax=Triparma laevis f. longispina TaxID=1714387 RepID=A0A9W7FKC4_9STRA|nr:hypothetical protein TrLO_g1155 [Triparma laevis f. longispina]